MAIVKLLLCGSDWMPFTLRGEWGCPHDYTGRAASHQVRHLIFGWCQFRGPIVTPATAKPRPYLPVWRPERLGEVRAAVDVQLAVGVHQVHVDGLGSDEQGLGNFAVAHAVRSHLGDTQLARGECVDAPQGQPARPRPGRA